MRTPDLLTWLRANLGWLARAPAETLKLENPRILWRCSILYFGLIVAFSVIFIPVLGARIQDWNKLRPRVFVNSWQPIRGEAAGFETEIAPVKLREAGAAGANHLVLGYFPSPYRINVDDVLLANGMGSDDAAPTVIVVPVPRMFLDKPLRISVELVVADGASRPLAGNAGFYTQEDVNRYKAASAFVRITRPFALGIVCLMLGLLFFYLWVTAPKESEYLFLSLFLTVSALIHLRATGTIDTPMPGHLWLALGFVLEVHRCLFGMFLGFAFARLRSRFFSHLLPPLLLAPLLAVPFLSDLYGATLFVRQTFRASAYLLGAFACLLQAVYLLSNRQSGSYLLTRVRRLLLFTASMVLLAVLVSQRRSHPNIGDFSLLELSKGFEVFAVSVFIGMLAASEYRQQTVFMGRTPVSKYHLCDPLPAEVRGVLLVVDLKCSEPFYNQRALSDDGENLVSLWRTHVYSATGRRGGVVVHKKGDEVAVFFDEAKQAKAVNDALRSSEDIAAASRLLERELQLRNVMPQDAKGFHFRGAIARARLAPIWEPLGSGREPGWEELRESNAFATIDRLFVVERKISGKRSVSLVLVPDELAGTTEKLEREPLAVAEDSAVFHPEAA